MTDESYLLDGNDKKKVNWISRLIKIGFILLAFFLVIITVLANMGGNSDMLKHSVAQFVSEMFKGRPVEVDTLNHMGFFPTVGVDVEGINVLSKPENGVPILRIEKLKAFMSFWNVATRHPHFSGLYAENIAAIKGFITPNEFTLEKLFIDHDIEAKTAQLRGNGTIGAHPWHVTASLDIFGSKGNYSFMLARSFPLRFDLADVTFEGTFINHEDNYFKVENFTLNQGNHSIIGNATLSALDKKLMKAKLDLTFLQKSNRLNADILIHDKKITGAATSDKIEMKDFDMLFNMIIHVRKILGYAKPENIAPEHAIDLELDFKDYENAGPLKQKLTQETITLPAASAPEQETPD